MILESVKADKTPHRLWTQALHTPDPWCFYIPAATPVLEADGRSWSSSYPVIAMFQPAAYWQVFLLLRSDRTDYYCNLISPPVYEVRQQTVRFVDLDLDVLVDSHGARLVDEEEFHARKSGYNPDWVDAVEETARTLLTTARCRKGPFAPATSEWWREWVLGQSGC